MPERAEERLEILLDRRNATRGMVDAEARCRIGEDGFTGVARNLSEEGLFIETSWSPGRGHKVEIDLSFHGYPVVLRLQGEVARVERDGVHGVGIRLVGIDAAARSELRNWFSIDG